MNLRAAIEDDFSNLPHHHYISIFAAIRRKTSRYSIEHLYKQYQYAKKATAEAPLDICNNSFTKIYGLPCKHRIITFLQQSKPIPLAEIHPFWKLDIAPDTRYLQILEPRRPPPRKVQRSEYSGMNLLVLGGKSDSSTQVESNKPAKQSINKCSKCGVLGHRVNSKDAPCRE